MCLASWGQFIPNCCTMDKISLRLNAVQMWLFPHSFSIAYGLQLAQFVQNRDKSNIF